MSARDQPPSAPEADLVKQLAEELIRCRQRGLERIEIGTWNQSPVETPQLGRLAHQYCQAQGLTLHGRIASISRLLREGLDAYMARGCDGDGMLIKELFFGDDTPAAQAKNAGELLDAALGRRDRSKRWFESKRGPLFHGFAEFLIGFVGETSTRTVITTSSTPTPDTALSPANMPASEATLATAPDKTPPAVLHVGPKTAPVSVRVGRRRPVRIAVTAAVAAAVVAVAWVTTHGGTFALPGASSHRFIGLPANGKTFTETVASGGGAVPFTDPYHVDETGPRIPFLQPVQVPCKVYSPVMPSIGPQAYWYRIASPPWNNHYYAPANSFLNGDPPHGPYTGKDIDPAVPDCPFTH
jgi:hypothetical protein